MGLRVQYTWRELNEDGTLTKFSLQDQDGKIYVSDTLFDSEEEAVEAFISCLGSNAYVSPDCVSPDCVVVKVYGWV